MTRRIEKKVSRTAGFVCFLRTWSYFEKNRFYKSDDYIAPMFIPRFWNFMARHGITRTMIEKLFFKLKGGYEYIVSRTKLIDGIFLDIPGKYDQVMIFGAGFDSRAIRFRSQLNGVKIFELDAAITQQAKIDVLNKNNIELPPNLKFVSIDFDKESLTRKLDEAGFEKNMRCLFVLEGLTYYLDNDSVDNTLKIIHEYSGKDSMIVFDYLYSSVIRQENTFHGEKELYQAAVKAGEKFRFGVEKGQIRDFLSRHDFELLDEFDSDRLARNYFTDEKGESVAPVFGFYSIVTAGKV